MTNDIIDYTISINTDSFDFSKIRNKEELLFSNVSFYSSSNTVKTIESYDIALIGVPEERNSKNKGTSKAPSKIRKELYSLYTPDKINIIDLGNIKKGKTVKDTYIALTEVIFELLKKELTVIIIGGSKDLIIPISNAYNKGKKLFNLCVAEPRLNLKESNDVFTEETYLSEIIDNNKKLFNYTNIGYQTYYNSQKDINYIKKKFEALRLGIARTKLFQNEPYIRDADFFAIDINSVKKSEAPGHNKPSIHGFYGDEICQLAKYAGFNDKLSTFGIFNLNPEFDKENQTAELAAQIIWHFIQAFYDRKKEYPPSIIRKFRKYIVSVEGIDNKIIFYKSTKTGRWWVEVPYKNKKTNKNKLISCTFDDYIKATGNEIPVRWWKFFQKLN